MSPVRALLQSMPPLFDAQSDLDEHVRDLQDAEEESKLDALLLASLEEHLLTTEAPAAITPVEPEAPAAAAESGVAQPTVAVTKGSAAKTVGAAVEAKAPEQPAKASQEVALTTDMPDVAMQQLATHRADLASVDQKLAFIDIDLDQAKVQAAEIAQALKLHHAQKACLISLRRAHSQFISRCSKDA